MYEFVKLEKVDTLATVTLNRPQKYNAWHAAMRAEVRAALAAVERDPDVRSIVLTGAGEKAFCAGQDLAETEQFDGGSAGTWMDEWKSTYGAIRSLTKPVVAALNGVAAGSGFQAALLCDVRVGHAGSRMGQPEINSGIPSTLGTWLLREMVGLSRAVELVLTGRMMEAEECHRLGLIHEIVSQDEVLSRATERARELGAKPPLAMKLNKQHLRDVTEPGFVAAEEAGRRIQQEAYGSGEPQEMMRQFFARRKGKPTG